MKSKSSLVTFSLKRAGEAVLGNIAMLPIFFSLIVFEYKYSEPTRIYVY